jgi:hypothetical protein
MPTARATGQRIAAGTITAASLTSTYAITNLPVQTDQDFSCPWVVDSSLCSTPTPARITTNADLSRSADGFYAWRLGFSYMTFDMFGYWTSTLLPGNAWSAPITVMDYDETDTAVFFNATIWRPNTPSDKAQYITGGWGRVVFDITKGTQIFP